ncbi:hypothetical protein FSP39_024687 [Pinctada imbricata]|uniref:C-type lectin domain-containing protein n=1 Tax=Pinctada imbricata TaxID=66713 RepID=A0AA89BJQ1_PINIB|nr:hypothetical protein FSP39_024687 [Pinctada imbricata]
MQNTEKTPQKEGQGTPTHTIETQNTTHKPPLQVTPKDGRLMTCEQYDAALVEIHDQQEQNFIASICQLSDGFWIGGTDAATEGEWRWGRSGEKITFEAWLQDEPNSSGNEDCIMIHGNRNYEWIDLNCDALRNFICERKYI